MPRSRITPLRLVLMLVRRLEANLDIEYTVGLATGVNTTFLSVGGDFAQAFIDTVAYLATVENPPTVVTTSYGDLESNFALADAKKFCDGYMALGARGITVLYASGDGGVRGASYDGTNECMNNTFVPSFPPTCPYGTPISLWVL
jgi:tripeptidyl-peptidase-1